MVILKFDLEMRLLSVTHVAHSITSIRNYIYELVQNFVSPVTFKISNLK